MTDATVTQVTQVTPFHKLSASPQGGEGAYSDPFDRSYTHILRKNLMPAANFVI